LAANPDQARGRVAAGSATLTGIGVRDPFHFKFMAGRKPRG